MNLNMRKLVSVKALPPFINYSRITCATITVVKRKLYASHIKFEKAEVNEIFSILPFHLSCSMEIFNPT